MHLAVSQRVGHKVLEIIFRKIHVVLQVCERDLCSTGQDETKGVARWSQTPITKRVDTVDDNSKQASRQGQVTRETRAQQSTSSTLPLEELLRDLDDDVH